MAAIHSVAGLLDGRPVVAQRPVRAPHCSISDAALLGGGTPVRPGEVTLAHGVLFLGHAGGRRLLEAASERLGLSARHTRASCAARMTADLAGEDEITTSHLAEAIQSRSLDRRPGA